VSSTRRPIKFLFSPANPTTKSVVKTGEAYGFEIKKESGGEKAGRYLVGISSGQDIDAHGDRMTDAAIDAMIAQGDSKDITLYVNHGKDFTRDIAVLTKSEKTPNGEWWTEYRLYDENDNVPDQDKQEADKVWRQAMGLAPYSRPREFGFSIEGYIPDDAIKIIERGVDGQAIRREISYVDLDPGVSLVPKPAYTSSIATAVKKALGKTQKSNLSEMIAVNDRENDYFEQKWQIENAFRELTDLIISSSSADEDKTQSLNEAFDSYRDLLVPVLLTRPSIEESESEVARPRSMVASVKDAGKLIKSILTTKGENMEQDLKTVLGDVIASLQMLQQSEDGSEEKEKAEEQLEKALAKAKSKLKKDDAPADPDDDKEKQEEAAKELARLAKMLGIKKDDAAPADDDKDKDKEETAKAFRALVKKLKKDADGDTDPDDDKEKQEAAAKALIALAKKLKKDAADGDPDDDDKKEEEAAKKLLKKLLAKEAEGNANEDVDTILEDVLPDENKEMLVKMLGFKTKKSTGTEKAVKALVPILAGLQTQQRETSEVLAQIVSGFTSPVQKGVATNYGNYDLMEKLKKQLGVTDKPETEKRFGETPIQKNKDLLASAFMSAVAGERAKAANNR